MLARFQLFFSLRTSQFENVWCPLLAERLDVEEAEALAQEDEDAGIIRRIPETTKYWP